MKPSLLRRAEFDKARDNAEDGAVGQAHAFQNCHTLIYKHTLPLRD